MESRLFPNAPKRFSSFITTEEALSCTVKIILASCVAIDYPFPMLFSVFFDFIRPLLKPPPKSLSPAGRFAYIVFARSLFFVLSILFIVLSPAIAAAALLIWMAFTDQKSSSFTMFLVVIFGLAWIGFIWQTFRDMF
ncbi:MAG: hypothetical protein LBL72_08405 [Candidatus Accumulibacter sp.]|nr:hypothetical protein [Accumulibacter sp.]